MPSRTGTEREREPLPDTELLDWLEHNSNPIRESFGGDGWYNADIRPQYQQPRYPTLRAAIYAAMANANHA